MRLGTKRVNYTFTTFPWGGGHEIYKLGDEILKD